MGWALFLSLASQIPQSWFEGSKDGSRFNLQYTSELRSPQVALAIMAALPARLKTLGNNPMFDWEPKM